MQHLNKTASEGHLLLFNTAHFVYISMSQKLHTPVFKDHINIHFTQVTLSYICSVNARTRRRLSNDLNCAYQMVLDGGE